MQKKIKKYLPETSIDLVVDLLDKYPHHLKIVNKRETKHGDFRKTKDGKYQITVNNNLNQYQFLLTLIHEIAHLATHLKYKRVKPHGIEWKRSFQHLLLPFFNPEIFPKELMPVLANYMKNPKASTDADVHLSLALKKYDPKNDMSYVFELPLQSKFSHNNRIFIRGNKRRTRIECKELGTNNKYLFHQNAEVKLLK